MGKRMWERMERMAVPFALRFPRAAGRWGGVLLHPVPRAAGRRGKRKKRMRERMERMAVPLAFPLRFPRGRLRRRAFPLWFPLPRSCQRARAGSSSLRSSGLVSSSSGFAPWRAARASSQRRASSWSSVLCQPLRLARKASRRVLYGRPARLGGVEFLRSAGGVSRFSSGRAALLFGQRFQPFQGFVLFQRSCSRRFYDRGEFFLPGFCLDFDGLFGGVGFTAGAAACAGGCGSSVNWFSQAGSSSLRSSGLVSSSSGFAPWRAAKSSQRRASSSSSEAGEADGEADGGADGEADGERMGKRMRERMALVRAAQPVGQVGGSGEKRMAKRMRNGWRFFEVPLNQSGRSAGGGRSGGEADAGMDGASSMPLNQSGRVGGGGGSGGGSGCGDGGRFSDAAQPVGHFVQAGEGRFLPVFLAAGPPRPESHSRSASAGSAVATGDSAGGRAAAHPVGRCFCRGGGCRRRCFRTACRPGRRASPGLRRRGFLRGAVPLRRRAIALSFNPGFLPGQFRPIGVRQAVRVLRRSWRFHRSAS